MQPLQVLLKLKISRLSTKIPKGLNHCCEYRHVVLVIFIHNLYPPSIIVSINLKTTLSQVFLWIRSQQVVDLRLQRTTMDFVIWTLALVARVWHSDIPDRLFNHLVTHLNKDKLFQIFGKINTKEIPLLCCKVKKKCGFMTNEGYIW